MKTGNDRGGRMRRSIAGSLVAAVACLTMTAAHAQETRRGVAKGQAVAGVEALEGRLADGTPYLVRKPSNWNGIVLSDLDGVTRKDDASYSMLLKAGYGTAGVTRRSPDRAWTLDRWEDMQRPLQALEIFKAKFGKPKLVMAFGRSAGGASSLLTSERHPDKVDGAVAMCSTMDFFGYASYNLIFDFYYVLKSLLAPNDDRLLTHALPQQGTRAFVDRWTEVLQNAAKTPEGRARIALAHTLVHYPLFGSHTVEQGVPKPDISDPNSMLEAMIRDLPALASRAGLLTVYDETEIPPDLEIPVSAYSNPVGNDGAVYADYWKNADPAYRRATEAIYAQAKLDLAADLRTIDASPRVSLDRDNMRREVLARGLPTVPVFRMDNLGDRTAARIATTLYDRLAAFNGIKDIRSSYVDNSGHCYFKPQQEFAAVEVMRERLQTGKWPTTTPAAMNARAGVNDGDGIIYAKLDSVPEIAIWRLKAYTDLFQPATFAGTSARVNSYQASLNAAQRQQMLAHLSAAERAAGQGQTELADAALDQFVGVVNGVANRIVRTRLLAATHQLRSVR